jgi:hypothetical protein
MRELFNNNGFLVTADGTKVDYIRGACDARRFIYPQWKGVEMKDRFDFKPPIPNVQYANSIKPGAALIAEQCTKTRRIGGIVCADQPDAHTAWIVIDHQSFCIGSMETEEEASWMCYRAAAAMERLFTKLQKHEFKITVAALKVAE